MPRGDGTGPAGLGPMTGRAAGYCAGYSVPGFLNPYSGRFLGAGRGFLGLQIGRGRGYRNWYYATGLPGWYRYNIGMPAWGGVVAPPLSPSVPPVHPYVAPFQNPTIAQDQEKEILKQQADFLKQQLDDINERLEELEKLEKYSEKESEN